MNTLLNYRARYTLDSHHDDTNEFSPDIFKIKTNSVNRPKNNFIISRNNDGSPLSFYGDRIWDFTPYKSNNSPSQAKIYFDKYSKPNQQDAKWILFVMLFMGESDRTIKISVSTILTYMKAIKSLDKFSTDHKLSIVKLLESEHYLKIFIKEANRPDILKKVSPILSNLAFLGHTRTGIDAIGGDILYLLNEKRIHIKNEKQHPVVPPRILSNYISCLFNHANMVIDNKNRIHGLIRHNITHNIRIDNTRNQTHTKIEFHKLITEHDLNELFNTLGINSIKDVFKLLTRTQHCCKTLIHIYSAMRSSEAFSLMTNCLNIEKTNHGNVLHLTGSTSKLTTFNKPTKWVTSKDIEDIIKLAEWITNTIVNYSKIRSKKIPLFLSTAYLTKPGLLNRNNLRVNSLANKKEEVDNYFDQSEFRIEPEDIKFLEMIDPFRAWQDEAEFKPGSIWRFTSHQFRRSLAYYASQSSLVSLPSLKKQLKHITNEMTIYYSNGSGRSNDYDQKDHFRDIYIRTKPEADSIAYINDVISSNEPLYGAHGTFIERNVRNSDIKTSIHKTREELLIRFKKGEIAYQTTPFGGCTTLDPCDKKAMREITACITCNRSIIKPSKLQNVINAQEYLVNELRIEDPLSMEYKLEKSILDTLNQLKNSITKSHTQK